MTHAKTSHNSTTSDDIKNMRHAVDNNRYLTPNEIVSHDDDDDGDDDGDEEEEEEDIHYLPPGIEDWAKDPKFDSLVLKLIEEEDKRFKV